MRAVLLIVVLGALSACSPDPPGAMPRTPVFAPQRLTAPQTAGTEECVACHPSQVESWSRSAMARTLEPSTPVEFEGLGAVFDEAGGYRYQFGRSPGGQLPVLGETRAAAPAQSLGVEVLFGIGSGTRDRSYVVARGAGMWFAPVEVIRRPEGRQAVLAPHAAIEPGSRFGTPISPECLGCHTDRPPPRSFPLNLRPAAREWQARGISCAACHGRAAAHARWQVADEGAVKPTGPDPLLLHETFSRAQRLSICAGCHLQGDARIVLDSHSLGPPPPGSDVLEQRALFVAREATSDVGFVSQVERLMLSRCFLETQMTCSSCHDPHRSLGEREERLRVRAACTRCHEQDGPPVTGRARHASASRCSRQRTSGIETHQRAVYAELQDCVDCHMPLSGVFDVARVTIHDHFVRRLVEDAQPPSVERNLRFAESPEADWRRVSWPWLEEQPSHMKDGGLLMMALASAGHLQAALEQLDVAAGACSAQLPMYHHVRGWLLESAARPEEAREAYQRALELDPLLAPSAINLGLLLGQEGDPAGGLELLGRVLTQYPLAWGALRNRAVLLAAVGDLEGARRDLERAFEALPEAELAIALASLCERSGDVRGALHWHEMARQLR